MDLAIKTPSWQFVLPIAPESIEVDYEGVFVPWTSISLGAFKIPAGRQPQALSFSVLLPGPSTLAQLYPDKSFVDEASFTAAANTEIAGALATDPLAYVADLQQAIEANKSLVYLLCHELRLGGVYFVEQVRAEHSGAFGDIKLTCQFTEYRPVTVSTVDSSGERTDPQPPAGGFVPVASDGTDDGTPSGGGSYTTGDADTLATVAARVRGISDPDAYSQQIWDFDGNADTITAAGGQQDGTLPSGVAIQLPPAS